MNNAQKPLPRHAPEVDDLSKAEHFCLVRLSFVSFRFVFVILTGTSCSNDDLSSSGDRKS